MSVHSAENDSRAFAEPAGQYGTVAVVDCTECGVHPAPDVETAERRAEMHREFQDHDAEARPRNE